VLRHPQLGRWLLRLSLHSDQEPRAWLGWLDPSATSAPTWLRRYAVLLTPVGAPLPPPTETSAEDDAETGEDLALIALFVLREGDLSRLADEWWPLLFGLARRQPEPNQPERAVGSRSPADLADLAEAVIDGPAPALPTAVRLDTLRLYLGLTPRYLPLPLGAPACERYLKELWQLWSQPSVDADVTALTCGLINSVQDAADQFGEAVVVLLRGVVTDDRIPLDQDIAGAIAGVLAAKAALIEHPSLTLDWWARVERLRPEIRTPAARLRAAVCREDADPVEIAVLCGRSAASGLSPEDFAAIAGPWLVRRPSAQVGPVLVILEGVLGLAAVEHCPPYEEYLLALGYGSAIPQEKPPSTFRRRRPPR